MLKPTATLEQMRAGMNWACEHGRTEVVRFLLHAGVLVKARPQPDRHTFLQSAALGGHADVVDLLLARGIPVGVVETRFGGTPLNWALHGWSNARSHSARDRYYAVVARLVRAGAAINPVWLDETAEQTLFSRTLRSEPRMVAALRGLPPQLSTRSASSA
jgi:hypothetical protein